jgi:hypothetical protein
MDLNAMPLTVCRCCGGKMDPDEDHRNPNVCSSCERLLEDQSPIFMAEMARMAKGNGTNKLIDRPEDSPKAEPKRADVPATEPKPSSKSKR